MARLPLPTLIEDAALGLYTVGWENADGDFVSVWSIPFAQSEDDVAEGYLMRKAAKEIADAVVVVARMAQQPL